MEPDPRFDLDQAVAAWREELARHPGLAAADVRELEAHLRDGFAELKKKDLSDEEAFLVARHRIGLPAPVAAEFAKRKVPRLWRSKLFWVTFLVVFGAFVGLGINQTPLYEAVASLRVNKVNVSPMQTVREPTTDILTPDEFNTDILLLGSDEVAQRVAEEMTAEQRQAFLAPFANTNPVDPNEKLMYRLWRQRRVQPGRLAYIIQVVVEHPNPQIAAIVADDFARASIEVNDQRNAERATNAVAVLQNDANEQKQRIDDLQTQMNALVQVNNVQSDELSKEKDVAENMYANMLVTIETQKERVLEGDDTFRLMESARGQVVQVAPRIDLFISAGLFVGFVAALVVTALVRLLAYIRRPPPPSAESVL
jgi:uncharacterized protein involved in exopolysaccharide biosynthesis